MLRDERKQPFCIPILHVAEAVLKGVAVDGAVPPVWARGILIQILLRQAAKPVHSHLQGFEDKALHHALPQVMDGVVVAQAELYAATLGTGRDDGYHGTFVFEGQADSSRLLILLFYALCVSRPLLEQCFGFLHFLRLFAQ